MWPSVKRSSAGAYTFELFDIYGDPPLELVSDGLETVYKGQRKKNL